MAERNAFTTASVPALFSSVESPPLSPVVRAERLFELAYSDRMQPSRFPAFTLKKSYWQKGRPKHRLQSPQRSVYASMPLFFKMQPPPGRPKQPPPPHKDLISALPKARMYYFPSSKMRKSRNQRSEADYWRPLTLTRSPREGDKDLAVEACRNMYLTYEAGKYGVKYKDEMKDGFQTKVLGYLEAHKGLKAAQSPEARKRTKGRLRLHPDKDDRSAKDGHSQVTPIITPIVIE